MNNAITVLNHEQVKIERHADALSRKQDALEQAAPIVSVSSQAEMQSAVNVMRSIKGITKYIEDSRVEVKAPILEIGRKIDQTAKDFVVELDTEYKRLDGITKAYAKIEADRLAEEAKKQELARELERRRIAEEQRVAAEAEAAKLQEIRKREEEIRNAAIKAQFAADEAGRLAAEKARKEAEAARFIQQRQLDNQRAENLRLQQEAIIAAQPVIIAPVKTDGYVAKTVWKFEVVNIWALAQARPELVTITEKTAEINRKLAAGEREIPGLKIFSEQQSSVRV